MFVFSGHMWRLTCKAVTLKRLSDIIFTIQHKVAIEEEE